MTLAAVDRLVRHSMISELSVESCRRRVASERKQQERGHGVLSRLSRVLT